MWAPRGSVSFPSRTCQLQALILFLTHCDASMTIYVITITEAQVKTTSYCIQTGLNAS